MESLFDTAEGGEDRERRLEELARQVSVCTKCDLAKTRTNTVFGTGDPYSPLMLFGEGPGENEDATGLPFVGRAGKLLDDILAAVDLTREQIYLTNVVKCRAAHPPNINTVKTNRTKHPPMIQPIAALKPVQGRRMPL